METLTVLPELKSLIPPLRQSVETVEMRHCSLCETLDGMCGIDFLQSYERGCRGIASRVQFGDINWRTFTVRQRTLAGHRTEFIKRKEAIEGGQIYPYWTCQAYINHAGKLLSVGLAKTECVYEAINAQTKIQRGPDAYFYAVNFDAVKGIWEGPQDETP
jgi:hypothetical protein